MTTSTEIKTTLAQEPKMEIDLHTPTKQARELRQAAASGMLVDLSSPCGKSPISVQSEAGSPLLDLDDWDTGTAGLGVVDDEDSDDDLL
jgi:hypothetical protein